MFNMISRVHRRSFSRPTFIGTTCQNPFVSLLTVKFGSYPDDKDSPAGVSVEAKNLSKSENDDTLLDAVKKVPKATTWKSVQTLKDNKKQPALQSTTWVSKAVSKKAGQKVVAEDQLESIIELSGSIKTIKQDSGKNPLDIFDESFFKGSRRRGGHRVDSTTKKSPWSLKRKEFEGEVSEAVKRITARAGEANAVLEEELMDGLDQLMKKTRRRQTSKTAHPPPTASEWDQIDANMRKIASNIPQKTAVFHEREKDAELDVLDLIKFDDRKIKQGQFSDSEKTKLFSSLDELLSLPPLKIFDSNLQPDSEPHLKVWSIFEEREVHRNTVFEPSNWWGQCIQWTEEGKLWHFPIDNEQGMDEESSVDFSEHIFLDQHIESWCPQEGPIKHFMDLVLVGLSKNPFLSVQEKTENIEWFRKYFEKHQTLLRDINAIDESSGLLQVENEEPKTKAA